MPGFTLSRRQALVAATCLLGFVLVAARLLSGPGAAAPARPVVPLTTPSTPSVQSPRALIVDVEGAVRRPGVYRLAAGARNADAIARAGGATRDADRSLLNLAAPLADGQQLLVPRAGSSAAASGAAALGAPTPPVDLNTASVEQLDTLPGVGPVTAQKIVDFRREHGP